MKAIVIHAPKDLRIEERNPAALGANQIEVDIEAGGICGSDLHYYNHGGFGDVRIREPMILGHEIAGKISALGSEVGGFDIGDRVAVSPSRPCGHCEYCQKGLQNHCLNMRFYGSAMPFPHIQGAFSQKLIVEPFQCFKVDASVSAHEAAFAEPFSVALHAVARAGSLLGKRVIVTGCGPIGALVIIAAKLHGAREIWATDVNDHVLDLAKKIGANNTINVATHSDDLREFTKNKGWFDVHFEASANSHAMRNGLEVLKPRGLMIQIGLGGDVALPQNLIVSKEIDVRGTFRFHEEFALAVDLMNQKRVDFSPLLTAIYPIDQAVEAFELASDKSRSMKVQIRF